MTKKCVVMFAGANGSGKSTRIGVNARVLPANYICPDNLLDLSIQDIRERYLDAMEKARKLREYALANGDDFVFETVFSTEEKLGFLKECKDNGYYIWSVYMATRNPRINIKRIKERVKNGGHHVPGGKVVDRYYKSMGFLSDIINISDEVHVYDNSLEEPVCVFIKSKGQMYLMNEGDSKEWVNKYILSRLDTGDIAKR